MMREFTFEELKERRPSNLVISEGFSRQTRIRRKPTIIVGGHAVELYTFSSYTTKDVDLVLEGYQKAGEILERLGFKKMPGSRHWYYEELGSPTPFEQRMVPSHRIKPALG